VAKAASPVSVPVVAVPPPEPPPAGAVVNAIPTGPPTPGAGWHVAFADGFGSALGAAAGQDNRWLIANGQGHNGNELQTFNPNQVSVGAEGLELKVSYCYQCSESFGSKKNYLGGQVETVDNTGSHFQWEPAQGDTWAFEVVAKIPPNTGQMDPAWWSTDYRWTDELDLTEWWGWNHTEYYAGIPVWKYKTSGAEVQHEIYKAKTELPNPETAYHRYTYVIQPSNAIDVYIDGRYRWTEPAIPSSSINVAKMGLIIQDALRVAETSDFQAGYRTEYIRSIAVYNSTGAHYVSGGVAPGTTVR
jgi:hypothetical protein